MKIESGKINGRKRSLIALSIIWVFICFIFALVSANNDSVRGFFYLSFIGFFSLLSIPVWVSWLVYWVCFGFKKKKIDCIHIDYTQEKQLDIKSDFLVGEKQCDDVSAIIHKTSPVPKINAWKRFFARQIDLYIFFPIFGFFWGIFGTFFPSTMPESNNILSIMMTLFAWMFVEAIFLSYWGTTFGKWLLKIRVRDNKGEKLTFLTSLERSFHVWLSGLAAGFPFIIWFTCIYAYRDLTRKGITKWDKDCNLIVTYQTVGAIRFIMTAILFIGLFSLEVFLFSLKH